jgi:hypothetical protein
MVQIKYNVKAQNLLKRLPFLRIPLPSLVCTFEAIITLCCSFHNREARESWLPLASNILQPSQPLLRILNLSMTRVSVFPERKISHNKYQPRRLFLKINFFNSHNRIDNLEKGI